MNKITKVLEKGMKVYLNSGINSISIFPLDGKEVKVIIEKLYKNYYMYDVEIDGYLLVNGFCENYTVKKIN